VCFRVANCLIATQDSSECCCAFIVCRHRQHDYIYEAELTAAVEDGALSKLHVASSRMGVQNDYVQHHIEPQAGALLQVAVRGGLQEG
jgi:sulfite reductase alpha subunit-like flavoprotein